MAPGRRRACAGGGNRGPGWCVAGWMLRAFGLLVAIAIALLLWAVRPSESRSLVEAESVPARAPAPSGTTVEPRWTDRPVPRLPDVSSAHVADEPDPWCGSGREALESAHHTDPMYPPESADQTVEMAEPYPPEDPDPLHAVEAVTEAEAEPEHVPTAADEELLARAVDFLDRFLSAIESNAGDCDRMADALSELLSGSRDLIAEGKAMADQPARRRWFESQMEAKATAGAERMMAPLQGCMSSERIMAVLTSFAE